MTTATTTPAAVGRRAAVDLAAIREQWGDLLAAIEQPPAAEWPPRECRGFLDQLAARDADLDEIPATAAIGRMPLVLREHPAPLNLDALDAALDTERELFELADTLAAAVQRSVRRALKPTRPGRTAAVVDGADRTDPARWHYASPTDPGSRAFGLHWAAVWCEGRALNEASGDLFRPVPLRLLDEVAAVARRSRERVERALGRDARTTTLDRLCPWCGGQLTGRTRAGGESSVTCSTGQACTAPVRADFRGHRAWHGAELVDLYAAMNVGSQTPTCP
ncbi:hypothetical protein [Streptomyces iconiensis]|uniref:Uncharacterized protein n=1 Tax=Streptomyces iconiensis TaxID=1384038 RepID=A0ABT7A4G7_9ACTN|nr:hypothetical protein [Streptomyces iconiensis]MDJ1136235.1 hypothetical protein [Streptomyces iconiensis]